MWPSLQTLHSMVHFSLSLQPISPDFNIDALFAGGHDPRGPSWHQLRHPRAARALPVPGHLVPAARQRAEHHVCLTVIGVSIGLAISSACQSPAIGTFGTGWTGWSTPPSSPDARDAGGPAPSPPSLRRAPLPLGAPSRSPPHRGPPRLADERLVRHLPRQGGGASVQVDQAKALCYHSFRCFPATARKAPAAEPNATEPNATDCENLGLGSGRAYGRTPHGQRAQRAAQIAHVLEMLDHDGLARGPRRCRSTRSR